MSYKTDNAIIMAAGFASRLVPVSFEIPKGLIKVKGEILIERQIKQLKEAGIDEIIVVVGYLKEKFYYLKEKFSVKIIENKQYSTRNNHSTIYAAKDYLKNSYICSSDNYFPLNPFRKEEEKAYYSGLFSKGKTDEWGMELDENDKIISSKPGGYNQWYILGHAFWSKDFSLKFIELLEKDYNKKETIPKLWDEVYLDHVDKLTLTVKKYPDNSIYEFDTLDELREFDSSYKTNSNCKIIKEISNIFNCQESELSTFLPLKNKNIITGFTFKYKNKTYSYELNTKNIKQV